MFNVQGVDRIKEYFVKSIEYFEVSKERRLVFVVFGSLLLGLVTWAMLWYWEQLDRSKMLEQQLALDLHRQEVSSSVAIEMLELCSQAKDREYKLAKYYCAEAETYTYRAIGDEGVQARVKEYFDKEAYLMAAIVVKNNFRHAKLDLETELKNDHEMQYLNRLSWSSTVVVLAIICPMIPYGVMYIRARGRRKNSWKDEL